MSVIYLGGPVVFLSPAAYIEHYQGWPSIALKLLQSQELLGNNSFLIAMNSDSSSSAHF